MQWNLMGEKSKKLCTCLRASVCVEHGKSLLPDERGQMFRIKNIQYAHTCIYIYNLQPSIMFPNENDPLPLFLLSSYE